MKRFSDMAAEVSATTRKPRADQPPPEAPSPMRHPHACAAAGCPLAGSISDSTTGGGPWECWHHRSRPAGMIADQVTTWLRNRIGPTGDLIEDRPAQTPTAIAMRAMLRERTSRVPGEDDA